MWQRGLTSHHRVVRQERDEREETKKSWSRAGNGLLRPLSLSLNAEMSAGSVERDFHLPAKHEPGQNLLRRRLQVGAQEGLRGKLSQWIADKHPADRDWRQAGMIPDGGLRDDLDRTPRFTVPVLDSERCPLGCCVIAPLLHGGKPFADHARTTDLLRRAGAVVEHTNGRRGVVE